MQYVRNILPLSSACTAKTVGRADEQGYTLIELIVVVGIIATVITTTVVLSHPSDQAEIHNSETLTSMMLNDTFLVAKNNAPWNPLSTSGATLQFTLDPQSGETVERIYMNRPLDEAKINRTLYPAPGAPVVRDNVTIAVNGFAAAPPFAIFIGPNEVVSFGAGYDASVGGPDNSQMLRRQERLPCGFGSVSMTFKRGSAHETIPLSCGGALLLIP